MPIIKLKYEMWKCFQNFHWKMRKMKILSIYIVYKAHMSNVHFNILGWNSNFHVNNFVSTFTTFKFSASQSFLTLTIWTFSFPFFKLLLCMCKYDMHQILWKFKTLNRCLNFATKVCGIICWWCDFCPQWFCNMQ